MRGLLRVLGLLSLLCGAAPLSFAQEAPVSGAWSAERQVPDPDAMVMAGFGLPRLAVSGPVRDELTHRAILAEVRGLFPSSPLEDSMTVEQVGIRSDWAIYALRVLARLESGRVRIAGGSLTLTGQSAQAEDSATVARRIAADLPAGLRAGPITVEPPHVAAYTWSAIRKPHGIRFDGYVPSAAAKTEILADAQTKFPDAEIEDHTLIASGAPNAFVPAARVGLDQLKESNSGLATIAGSNFSVWANVAGDAASSAAVGSALRTRARASLPENFNSDAVVVGVPAGAGDDPRSVDFLYATDRARQDQGLATAFGFNRSPSLTYGVARVHVPEDHKLGRIELPGSGWSVLGLTFGREDLDPRKHFIVKSVEVLPRTQWTSLASGRGKEALVFVHGFNTSFEDAVLRTAQVVWDLQYKGTAVLFSWPSRGEVLSYEWDRNSALVARAHFIDLLRTLQDEAGIEKVNVIAHSMGNLVVLDALSNYAQTSNPLRISQLIMAAPDVDLDQYEQAVPNIAKVAEGMTLYASSADRALLASRSLAQGPRAGDVTNGSPALAPGVDAIDVTAVGDELFGLNHGVFADNRSLIDDISLVLQGRRPPDARLAQIRTMPEGAATPRFWRYAP